jgi:methyl-accepting chemotaxis protein
MSWLNHLKIVWKIALIVTLLGAVSFLSMGFAAMRMRVIDEAYSNLVNQVDVATVAVARGNRNVESYVSLVYQLLLEPSAEGSSRLLARNTEEKKMYEERFEEALRLIPEKANELNHLHDKAQRMFGECAFVVQAVAEASTADESSKAVELLKSKCSPLSDAVLDEQTKVVYDLISYAGKTAGDVSGETRFTIKTVLIFVTIGLTISLLGAMWIGIKGLAQPIARLKAAMERLAADDLQAVVPEVDRRDEIGQMAKAVEILKTNGLEVERLKAERTESDHQAARHRKEDMQRLAASFEGAVGDIIQNVSSAATKMEASANSLTMTAEKTAKLSTVVAAAAEEASTNVQSVASASEEMASSVQEISRQVRESATIAGRAVAQAEETNERVARLSDAARKIGDVIDLINTIAGQTNLLALNATIEAVRAGTAGRGFAVVAAEVKSLAEQTAKATGEIAQQISSIQIATEESVSAIKEITDTITCVSEISSTVAITIEELGAATGQIAKNVQQASEGTSTVASNIGDVQRGSSETGVASAEVFSAARSLSAESHRLKNEVGSFLTTVRAA